MRCTLLVALLNAAALRKSVHLCLSSLRRIGTHLLFGGEAFARKGRGATEESEAHRPRGSRPAGAGCAFALPTARKTDSALNVSPQRCTKYYSAQNNYCTAQGSPAAALSLMCSPRCPPLFRPSVLPQNPHGGRAPQRILLVCTFSDATQTTVGVPLMHFPQETSQPQKGTEETSASLMSARLALPVDCQWQCQWRRAVFFFRVQRITTPLKTPCTSKSLRSFPWAFI